MNPEIAVIINSMNRVELLKECLPNVMETLAKINIPFVIFIFDAGSTDGSVEYIKGMKNQHKSSVILLEANLSFSAGCNKAVNAALDRYPSLFYLLFFETDNLFKSEIPLQRAFELMKAKDEFASVGFTIEKMSGEKMVFGNRKPTVAGFILGQSLATKLGMEQVKPKWHKNGIVEYTYADIVFTSPLVVRTEAWIKAGGMDEKNFPFSDSDTDLCYKFLKLSYKNGVVSAPGVVHDNRNNISRWSAQRVYNYHQARYRLLTKHTSWSKWILNVFLPLRHLFELLAGVLLKKSPDYVRNRKRLLFSIWNGYAD